MCKCYTPSLGPSKSTTKRLPTRRKHIVCVVKIGFAQINPTVGDLNGNFEKIVGAYERLAERGAELVLTPELAITGYPPQDLVFKSRFVPQNLEVLDKLQARLRGAALLVGYVERNQGRGKPFHHRGGALTWTNHTTSAPAPDRRPT